MDPLEIIKIAWPLIVLQLGLQIYAIVEILNKKKTKTLQPLYWIIIVLLFEIFGAILYFFLGRSEE